MAVEQAILGGATMVQFREKELTGARLEQDARAVQAVCRKHGVPFIMNNDVDLAQKLDADGVHVGQSDLPAAEARRRLGPAKIIGVTARTVAEAQAAEAAGADYLGSGAVFGTSTKKDARTMTVERLREIAATDKTLRALLGDGVYWLRPPWGFLAPQTAAAVEVPMVYWSLDTEDWRRLDADAVAQDIIDHARDGDIILLHDPYTTSVEAALRAIDALTPQGYRFVTLEELFRQKGVEPEPGKLYIRPDELKRIA